MRNPIRIYLGDLGYYNDYNHTQPTPLNVGYVGSYLKEHLPELEIELFKNPIHMLERIKEQPPQIISLSHYQWNSNLNHKILEITKGCNPDTISILGGPHFNAVDRDWTARFFAEQPNIDFHIEREGEETFRCLIQSLIEVDFDKEKTSIEDWPSTVFSYDHAEGKLLNNATGTSDRLDLSKVSSPYLTGWMDKFLDDEHLAPIIETNRGCPYSCTFCAWGAATQSKVRQFPLEQVIEEVRYVAKRSKNPQKLLYLADANFGILKRDEDIAQAIADSTLESGFPKSNYVYFAKNTNDRVIKVAEIMKSITSMSMSKQSVNDDVLANIKRKNIPHQQYDHLSKECERRGITTFSELIYGLPGETYESFIDGVIKTVRQGAKVALYPLLLLQGAENHTQADREQFGIKVKYRVCPRYISTMEGLQTLEYEEVAYENDVLPFDDWLRIREFHFLIVLLASDVFLDLKKELEVHDLDYATLAKRMLEDREKWPEKWSNMFAEFRQAAVDELLDPEDLTVEYDPEQISDIELKYPAQNYYYFAALACDKQLLDALHIYMSDGVQRLIGSKASDQAIDGIQMALKLCFDRFICYEDFQSSKDISYPLDLNVLNGQSNSEPASSQIQDCRLGQEVGYQLHADPTIEPQLQELLESGMKLHEAVYKLRIGFIGYRGDLVFAYERSKYEMPSLSVA